MPAPTQTRTARRFTSFTPFSPASPAWQPLQPVGNSHCSNGVSGCSCPKKGAQFLRDAPDNARDEVYKMIMYKECAFGLANPALLTIRRQLVRPVLMVHGFPTIRMEMRIVQGTTDEASVAQTCETIFSSRVLPPPHQPSKDELEWGSRGSRNVASPGGTVEERARHLVAPQVTEAIKGHIVMEAPAAKRQALASDGGASRKGGDGFDLDRVPIWDLSYLKQRFSAKLDPLDLGVALRYESNVHVHDDPCDNKIGVRATAIRTRSMQDQGGGGMVAW